MGLSLDLISDFGFDGDVSFDAVRIKSSCAPLAFLSAETSRPRRH
eukprot:CAMPEP_0202852722 /NCGR_PEP_ID=MMETSP1389-20130828/89846_1 /ASSEMBLY_ACC=CAM_ASM_000865 /TAXON_ID=302021 /ORGANISM="Rhodomonas sp., Strain CCMP768" /LENGTH=44 /DNA_ID= /DNA_START= /DNA_END= /DNA_ORIENTATION=